LPRLYWMVLLLLPLGLEAASLRQEMVQAIKAGLPFSVRFVQQVFVGEEKEIEESGDILICASDRLRWSYRQPDFKVFLLQGSNYSFYNAAEKQLIKGRIGSSDQHLVWQIMATDQPGDTLRVDEKKRRIYLKRTTAENPLDLEIEVGRDLLPTRVVQHDGNGLDTIYLFTSYKTGVPCGAGDFLLTLPAGVEIVEE
jgi:outer membrane lipoprotein-sorting protein